MPAKVNLFLGVRGVREDGYHELVTVFQSVDVNDVLTLRLDRRLERFNHPSARRRMALRLTHDAGEAIPVDGRNLVLAAARVLADRHGVTLTRPDDRDTDSVATHIELAKHIPVAGGMAGGSADAAGALLGLAELWGLRASRAELRDLAAELGSDVPFTVVGGTALATGTGTGFTRVLCRGTFHWVVCTAAEELSTPEVYRTWDTHCEPNEIEPDAVLAAVASGDAVALGGALHNDLQPAAELLLPRLVEDRRALLEAGALGAVVSGSGPTLVGLASDPAHAGRLADRVAERFARVLVTTSPAGGPVATLC